MRYVWDPAKDALNRRKHGLALEDGVPALEDESREFWIDDRFDYGEIRFVTLGLSAKGTLYVVSSVPEIEITRIISVRKARKNELKKYGRL